MEFCGWNEVAGGSLDLALADEVGAKERSSKWADVCCTVEVLGGIDKRSMRIGLVSSDAVVDEIDGSGGAVVCGKLSNTSGLTRMLRRRPSVSSALMISLGKRFDGV